MGPSCFLGDPLYVLSCTQETHMIIATSNYKSQNATQTRDVLFHTASSGPGTQTRMVNLITYHTALRNAAIDAGYCKQAC